MRLAVPGSALPLVELALESLGGAVVTDCRPGEAVVPVAIYMAQRPDRDRIAGLLAAAGVAAEVDVERLPDTDWVAQSQRALPALRIGPFYVHGAHVTAPAPAGSLPLRIEANVAFGTGRHESTRGCLLALAALAAERPLGRALDMGCGSGILAIAMAKLGAAPVLAVDNVGEAVRVAAENAALNQVAGTVATAQGDGYGCPAVGAGGPYDVIVENILADAVCAMAADLRRHLAPGGHAVLSGLLADQSEAVLAAHAPMRCVRDWRFGDWSTLVLRK